MNFMEVLKNIGEYFNDNFYAARKRAEQMLIDNGIEPDEAPIVLQAIGYVLFDTELYPEDEIKEDCNED